MTAMLIVGFIAHLIAALAFGYVVLASYRWIRQRSAVIGTIVAIGIMARLAIGCALFWISYLHLPIAQSLQHGGGFWNQFLDATGYYQITADAADRHTVFAFADAQVPSPFFVDTLALTMMAVGISRSEERRVGKECRL